MNNAQKVYGSESFVLRVREENGRIHVYCHWIDKRTGLERHPLAYLLGHNALSMESKK